MKFRIAFLLFVTGTLVFGQPASAFQKKQATKWSINFKKNEELPPGFRQVNAVRKDKSELPIFLGNFKDSLEAKKPLLVYVEGSGAQSHFVKLDDGRIAWSTFGLIAKNHSKAHHVATLEKRGVPFGFSGIRGAGEGASKEYNKHATLANRVKDVRLTLDALLKDPMVDKSQVILLGHSEGADVVAAVSAEDKRVTHVAFLSGGGTAQFFDFFVTQRKKLAAQGATPEEAEKKIAAVEAQIREILKDPDNDKKFFAGHSFKRWSTFATVSAADNLVKTKAKLFLGHGTEDQSVPIESFDFLVVKLLCHGRHDAVVRRYVGVDHSFIKVGDKPSNEPFQKVIGEVISWAAKKK